MIFKLFVLTIFCLHFRTSWWHVNYDSKAISNASILSWLLTVSREYAKKKVNEGEVRGILQRRETVCWRMVTRLGNALLLAVSNGVYMPRGYIQTFKEDTKEEGRDKMVLGRSKREGIQKLVYGLVMINDNNENDEDDE